MKKDKLFIANMIIGNLCTILVSLNICLIAIATSYVNTLTPIILKNIILQENLIILLFSVSYIIINYIFYKKNNKKVTITLTIIGVTFLIYQIYKTLSIIFF